VAAAIPYIMVAAAVAGTAVSVYSSIRAGQVEKEAREREAAQLERSAAQARKAAQQKAEDTKQKHRSLLAAQRARYAAAGFTGEGTPLLVQMESVKESEDEIRRIIEEGELGYTAATESAAEARRLGGEAQVSGYLSAAGSTAQGAGTLGRIARNYWWK